MFSEAFFIVSLEYDLYVFRAKGVGKIFIQYPLLPVFVEKYSVTIKLIFPCFS